MKKRKTPKSNLLAYQAEKAFKEAVAEAIYEHKRKGIPIVVWRDGKVVEIAPEQIEVREPQAEYTALPKKNLRRAKWLCLSSQKAEGQLENQGDTRAERARKTGHL